MESGIEIAVNLAGLSGPAYTEAVAALTALGGPYAEQTTFAGWQRLLERHFAWPAPDARATADHVAARLLRPCDGPSELVVRLFAVGPGSSRRERLPAAAAEYWYGAADYEAVRAAAA